MAIRSSLIGEKPKGPRATSRTTKDEIWIRTTAPRPKTATVLLTSTLQVFHTAPKPVEIPHPKRHIFFKSAAGSILAHEISAKTVYSDMVEQPINCMHRRLGGGNMVRKLIGIHVYWLEGFCNLRGK
eukprot:scaffold6121_cov170-Amphora_coffeaeformis.AAC.4